MAERNKPDNITRRDIEFYVDLTLEAPILTRATEAAPGLSEAAARDHRGRFYLAASLIKGCLRESLEEIRRILQVKQHEIDTWFGVESINSTDDTPSRGQFSFSDFTTTRKADSQTGIRIRIDPDRGAVDQGALAFLELPFAPGLAITFSGVIRTTAADRREQQRLQEIITRGLRWIPAFGGQQGIGFGRLLSVEITTHSRCFPSPAPVSKTTPCPSSLYLSVVPDAPFCLADHLALNNRFETSEIISGAVLKGVIAHTLNRLTGRDINRPLDATLPEPWQELGAYFHRLHFTHAFPVSWMPGGPPPSPQVRPVQPPLSTVVAEGEIFDVALKKGPGLICGSAPKFAADWKNKDYQAVRRSFLWPDDLVKKLRVRTAIDRNRRRAEDEKLFAMELLVPDGHEWLCRVDLHFDDDKPVPTADRNLIVDRLQALLAYGLVGLGKTKVPVSIRFSKEAPAKESFVKPLSMQFQGKTLPVWVVTLQTETLMIDPREVAGPVKCSADNLEHQYKKYWSEISNALQMLTFFAAQSLRGRYLNRRFQAGKPYNPYLLTNAGSVFILTAGKENIRETGELLAELQERGLPLPATWSGEVYGQGKDIQPTWRECPWLPENGFGEIKVNLPCHTAPCPNWEDI